MMGLTLGKAILYSSYLVAAFISHIHIFIGHRYTWGPIYGSRYSKPGFLHHCQDTSDSAFIFTIIILSISPPTLPISYSSNHQQMFLFIGREKDEA